MNPKNERIIIILGVAVAGWMLWFLTFSPEHSLPNDRIVEQPKRDLKYPQMIVRSTDDASLSEDRAEGTTVGRKPFPKGAKPGERVYQFESAEALNQFLDEAKQRGITVLGVLDEFNAVRVSDSGYMPKGAEELFNYWVNMPHSPDEAAMQTSGSVPFEGEALASLGIDQVDPTWGSGVRIAVLDTGVSEHPSLAEAKVERKQVENVTLGDGVDDNGHGTAAISIIAGNDDYVQGLAPAAEIMSYKILDEYGKGDTFSLSAAILDAIASGVDVISISAGSLSNDILLQQAVLLAATRGIPIIAGGGNNGTYLAQYPAAYSTVIGVGSIDKNGLRSSYSNMGSVSIVAPSDSYSGWINGEHALFYGTSASTLFVTATIAAVMSQNTFMSASDAAALVLKNTNEAGPAGDDDFFGKGLLDTARAFRSNQPGFVDAGVATPFVLASRGGNDGNAEIVFSIQNQGTVFLPNAHLDIELDGQKYTYPTMGLQKGESKSVSISIALDSITAENPTNIKVKARLDDSAEDMDSSNNEITIRLEPKP